MEEKTNRCQIIRTGNVLQIGEVQAIILIKGRPVPVPAEKLAQRIQAGDDVKWTGTKWEKIPSGK